MPRGITTVVFDVYETLVPNPPEQWVETFGEVVRTQGLDIHPAELFRLWKEREVDFRRTRLNLEEPEASPPFKTYEQAWRECFAQVFAAQGLPGDAAAAAHLCVQAMGQRQPFPDAVQGLRQVQARYRTAILSNADDAYLFPIVERLEREGIRFQAVLSSEGARAYKPHPGAFAQVLALVGARPEETAYVGDAQFEDVYGGRRAGLWTVWVDRNGVRLREDLPTPHYRVRALTELVEVLERDPGEVLAG